MCGRYSLSKKQMRVVSRYSQEGFVLFLQERFNIAPTQVVPTIHIFGGVPNRKDMRWGLQPSWSKAPIINAQAETVLEKRTFRDGVLNQRCLVPADGFYEWRGKVP